MISFPLGQKPRVLTLLIGWINRNSIRASPPLLSFFVFFCTYRSFFTCNSLNIDSIRRTSAAQRIQSTPVYWLIARIVFLSSLILRKKLGPRPALSISYSVKFLEIPSYSLLNQASKDCSLHKNYLDHMHNFFILVHELVNSLLEGALIMNFPQPRWRCLQLYGDLIKRAQGRDFISNQFQGLCLVRGKITC